MVKLFFEIHSDIPREGPGLNSCTKKVFEMLENLPKKPLILDVGCGPGMQTLELAQNTDGSIVAIDVHQPFLNRLANEVRALQLTNRIEVQNRSMFDLRFNEENFDLIWSEGSIFIIGFKKGISEWKRYIKKNGYLVASEVSWLRADLPKELKIYWESRYPQINRVSENIRIIEDAEYSPVGCAILPEDGWWINYYNPLIKRLENLRNKYKDNPKIIGRIKSTEKEIDIFRKYNKYFGYVFYVMKKL